MYAHTKFQYSMMYTKGDIQKKPPRINLGRVKFWNSVCKWSLHLTFFLMNCLILYHIEIVIVIFWWRGKGKAEQMHAVSYSKCACARKCVCRVHLLLSSRQGLHHNRSLFHNICWPQVLPECIDACFGLCTLAQPLHMLRQKGGMCPLGQNRRSLSQW